MDAWKRGRPRVENACRVVVQSCVTVEDAKMLKVAVERDGYRSMSSWVRAVLSRAARKWWR